MAMLFIVTSRGFAFAIFVMMLAAFVAVAAVPLSVAVVSISCHFAAMIGCDGRVVSGQRCDDDDVVG
jgi:hypothetical protein